MKSNSQHHVSRSSIRYVSSSIISRPPSSSPLLLLVQSPIPFRNQTPLPPFHSFSALKSHSEPITANLLFILRAARWQQSEQPTGSRPRLPSGLRVSQALRARRHRRRGLSSPSSHQRGREWWQGWRWEQRWRTRRGR